MQHKIFHSVFDSSKKAVNIFVFGDMQWGVKGFNQEAWEQFEHEFKTTENALAIGLGDYMDDFRPTMRDRIYKAVDHETKLSLEKMYLTEHDKLIRKMEFLDGKMIGVHNGHHCYEFTSGINSDQRLASALHAPYLGWVATNRIVLSEKKGIGSCVYTILSMHGQANGRRTGAATGWMENNFSNIIVDQYVMGHNVKSIAWTPEERWLIRRKGKAGITYQLPRMMNVGGFSNGYTDGWETTWVERMGFKPQPVSWGLITLKIVSASKEMSEREETSRLRRLHVENIIRHPDSIVTTDE